MNKYGLKELLKISNELALVFVQFLIIFLHFIKLEFFTKKEIIQVNLIFSFVGFLIIIIASISMLMAI